MWILLVVGALALLVAALAKPVARRITRKLIGRLATRYKLEIGANKVRFFRWDTLVLEDIVVASTDFRRKAEVGRLHLQLDYGSVLTGKVGLKQVRVTDVRVLVHAGKGAAPRGNAAPAADPAGGDRTPGMHCDVVARLLGKMLRQSDRIFKFSGLLGPGSVEITALVMRLKFKNYVIGGELARFVLAEGHYEGEATLTDNGVTRPCRVSGTLSPRQKRFSVQLAAASEEKVFMPGLNRRYNAEVAFAALRLEVEKAAGMHSGQYTVGMEADGLLLNHPALGSQTVALNQVTSRGSFQYGEGSLALAPGSYLAVNGIRLHLELKYKFRPAREILVQLRVAETPAEAVLSALPPGVFNLLEGLRVQGVFGFQCLYFLNFSRPADFVFEASLDSRRVTLTQASVVDLGRLMKPFVHQVYENGQLVKSIALDPGAPQFTALAQLPPHLIETILCTEDREFRTHEGFDEYLYGYAITADLVEGRFARGGSTLTMQVVKNVLLHHDKTLLRKLEEMLVVWTLERFRLVTKERLLEIYFNIAEWGPQVYGIREAAHFYFAKEPAQLTLSESLYLSFVLPRPKSFLKRLGTDPAFGEQLVRHMKYFAKSMLDRRLITPAQYSTVRYDRVLAVQPAIPN